jgi:predicted metalloprotease with PDZ domain
MMLDITIRTASGGARSYDDVLRYLYSEYFKKGKNYTPADFQKAAEIAAGRSLEDFFSRYVRGRADIDYNSILSGIGLRLAVEDPDAGEGYIGADLSDQGGQLTIRSIPADTPAYEQGLNTGDQIVAVDGFRANTSFLNSYIGERKPGDKIRLTLFRFDKLREVEFTLGAASRKHYGIVPVENPADEQKRLFRGYLNAEL